MTVAPAANLWLRLGPSWLRGNIKEDLVYFQTYSSQNSANTSFSMDWVMPFNRLTLNPGLAYLNTNDRPGFEIDARAPRVETDYNGILELRLASKTFVGARFDSAQDRLCSRRRVQWHEPSPGVEPDGDHGGSHPAVSGDVLDERHV